MKKITYLKNQITGDIKTLRGNDFNWDLFLLGVIYLFKEGDIKNGTKLLLLTLIPMCIILVSIPNYELAGIFYCLIVLFLTAKDYNKIRTQELIQEGYEIITF